MQLHRLIDLAKNKYSEDVTRLVGVAAGSAVKLTRLDRRGYTARRPTRQQRAPRRY